MLETEFYQKLVRDNVIQSISGTAGIYYNNIMQARIDTLIDIFPAVTACLSEDYIRYIAQDYSKKHDALSGNLNLYGYGFGAYLASLPLCGAYPYMRDLADFEYSVQCLLYAVDENHLLPDNFIQAVQNEKSPLLSKSSLGFLSCYAIDDIADFCLGKTEIKPNVNEIIAYYFLYRDTVTQKVFMKSITAQQTEIIPVLKTQGILGINDTLLGNQEINVFLSFLTANNLWIL